LGLDISEDSEGKQKKVIGKKTRTKKKSKKKNTPKASGRKKAKLHSLVGELTAGPQQSKFPEECQKTQVVCKIRVIVAEDQAQVTATGLKGGILESRRVRQ